MSIHDHPHKRRGEARCQGFVAAPWTRFGHACCSVAPRPRRTSVAACTCRARRRIKLSAKRRTEVSSRSSRTSTRTTTTALSRGTSTPRTGSSCGSATNSGFEADTARARLRHGGAGGSEWHDDELSCRLVGGPNSPRRALRPPGGGQGGGECAECAHGHDLRERGRSRRGRRLVPAQRRRFSAPGGMARQFGAAARPLGFQGKSTAGSTGVGSPEKLTDCSSSRPDEFESSQGTRSISEFLR